MTRSTPNHWFPEATLTWRPTMSEWLYLSEPQFFFVNWVWSSLPHSLTLRLKMMTMNVLYKLSHATYMWLNIIIWDQRRNKQVGLEGQRGQEGGDWDGASKDEEIHTGGEEVLYFKVGNWGIKLKRHRGGTVTDCTEDREENKVRGGALPLPWTSGLWFLRYWVSSP